MMKEGKIEKCSQILKQFQRKHDSTRFFAGYQSLYACYFRATHQRNVMIFLVRSWKAVAVYKANPFRDGTQYQWIEKRTSASILDSGADVEMEALDNNTEGMMIQLEQDLDFLDRTLLARQVDPQGEWIWMDRRPAANAGEDETPGGRPCAEMTFPRYEENSDTDDDLEDLTVIFGRALFGSATYRQQKRWKNRAGFSKPVSCVIDYMAESDYEKLCLQWSLDQDFSPEPSKVGSGQDGVPLWDAKVTAFKGQMCLFQPLNVYKEREVEEGTQRIFEKTGLPTIAEVPFRLYLADEELSVYHHFCSLSFGGFRREFVVSAQELSSHSSDSVRTSSGSGHGSTWIGGCQHQSIQHCRWRTFGGLQNYMKDQRRSVFSEGKEKRPHCVPFVPLKQRLCIMHENSENALSDFCIPDIYRARMFRVRKEEFMKHRIYSRLNRLPSFNDMPAFSSGLHCVGEVVFCVPKTLAVNRRRRRLAGRRPDEAILSCDCKVPSARLHSDRVSVASSVCQLSPSGSEFGDRTGDRRSLPIPSSREMAVREQAQRAEELICYWLIETGYCSWHCGRERVLAAPHSTEPPSEETGPKLTFEQSPDDQPPFATSGGEQAERVERVESLEVCSGELLGGRI